MLATNDDNNNKINSTTATTATSTPIDILNDNDILLQVGTEKTTRTATSSTTSTTSDVGDVELTSIHNNNNSDTNDSDNDSYSENNTPSKSKESNNNSVIGMMANSGRKRKHSRLLWMAHCCSNNNNNNNGSPATTSSNASSLSLLEEVWQSTEQIFESRLTWLLVLAPFALLNDKSTNFGEMIAFTFSGIVLIPCAERLSFVTEQVALHTNGTIGALLNATFGNAPEFLIATAALRSGYYRVVQLAMLGSMLSNLLLVFGFSCFIGGMRWQVQDVRTTSGNVSVQMLLLGTGGSLLPAALFMSGQLPGRSSSTFTSNHNDIPTKEELQFSRVNAAVLAVMYLCYLLFQLGTHAEEFSDNGTNNNNSLDENDDYYDDGDNESSSYQQQQRRRVFVPRRNEFCRGVCDYFTNTFFSPQPQQQQQQQAQQQEQQQQQQPLVELSSIITPAGSLASGLASGSALGDIAMDNNNNHEYKSLLKSTGSDIESDNHTNTTTIENNNKKNEDGNHNNNVTVVDSFMSGGGITTTNRRRRNLLTKKSSLESNEDSIIINNNNNNNSVMMTNGIIGNSNGGNGSVGAGGTLHNYETMNYNNNNNTDEKLLSLRMGILWLLIITLCISSMSDILVESLDGFVSKLKLSAVFTSIIIVPYFSNVAEQVSAVIFAYKNEMDLCVGVTVGSAIQVSSFVLPGTVLIGAYLDRSMTLFFHGYETTCLFFSVLCIATVLQGGKTNWFIGICLIGIYILIATGFWFHEMEQLSVDAELVIKNVTNNNN